MEDTAKFDVLMPTVVKSPDEEGEIGILRQFPFSSSLQVTSTIRRTMFRNSITNYSNKKYQIALPYSLGVAARRA
jgi:hypothetical protein